MSDAKFDAPGAPPQGFNLVCGSGGSRAILGCAGAILACHLSGIRKWNKIGGSSGGSIPAVLLASGMHPVQVAHKAIEIDFTEMLTRQTGMLGVIYAFLMKYRYDKSRPIKGVFSTEKLNQYIETLVPTWPDNFWTMAVVGNARYVFTVDGVFCYEQDGTKTQLETTPPSPAIAVRGSIAVPGIINAVPYRGVHLFDGAIGDDGRCPVEPIKYHFGHRHADTIAIDVGEDSIKNSRIIRAAWGLMCKMGACGTWHAKDPDTSEGLILLEPGKVDFHSLKFNLSEQDKWQGLMTGFTGAIEPLSKAGILTGEALCKAQSIALAYEDLRKTRKGRKAVPDEMRKMLAANGLF